MDWKPYGPCCARHAANPKAAFCPECRHPLLRCMASAECGQLVTPSGPCPACLAPALFVNAGAQVRARAGERLSVPFVLRNASSAGRPLWVKRLARLDAASDEPVALKWQQIDAGTERQFSINTPPIETAGTHELALLLVAATRHRGVEEAYAFRAVVPVAVTAVTAPQSIQQNIIVHAAESQGNGVATAGAVSAPLNVRVDDDGVTTALTDRMPLTLERAEVYELEQDVRGYRRQGVRVHRHVTFAFEGFRDDERPHDGVGLGAEGRLTFGRNSRTPSSQGGDTNDVCLRVYRRDGVLDEAATMAVSRHHFELVVANERLCVLATTSRGMQVNGHGVASGALVELTSGDRIQPIAGHTNRLTLGIEFKASMGVVERVTVRKLAPAH